MVNGFDQFRHFDTSPIPKYRAKQEKALKAFYMDKLPSPNGC
jgi:hypothetical protein